MTEVVALPPIRPALQPVNYVVTGAMTANVVVVLSLIFPSWTAIQTGAVAALVVGAVGAVHQMIKWYVGWKWPTAPDLPLT